MTVASRIACSLVLPLLAVAGAGGRTTSEAADAPPPPPLAIHRAAGPIVVDGVLTDAGWQGAEPIGRASCRERV